MSWCILSIFFALLNRADSSKTQAVMMETRDDKHQTRCFLNPLPRIYSHPLSPPVQARRERGPACHFLPEHAGEKLVGVKLRRLLVPSTCKRTIAEYWHQVPSCIFHVRHKRARAKSQEPRPGLGIGEFDRNPVKGIFHRTSTELGKQLKTATGTMDACTSRVSSYFSGDSNPSSTRLTVAAP